MQLKVIEEGRSWCLIKGIGFGSILGRLDFLLRESPNLAPEVMALYRLDLPEEYGVSNTFNIIVLVPFAGVANSDDEGSADLRTSPLQEGHDNAILPRRGPITKAMARRLKEDWVRDPGEGPMVLMSLRVDFGPMG